MGKVNLAGFWSGSGTGMFLLTLILLRTDPSDDSSCCQTGRVGFWTFQLSESEVLPSPVSQTNMSQQNLSSGLSRVHVLVLMTRRRFNDAFAAPGKQQPVVQQQCFIPAVLNASSEPGSGSSTHRAETGPTPACCLQGPSP